MLLHEYQERIASGRLQADANQVSLRCNKVQFRTAGNVNCGALHLSARSANLTCAADYLTADLAPLTIAPLSVLRHSAHAITPSEPSCQRQEVEAV